MYFNLFSIIAPKPCNKLPNKIKICESIKTFFKLLKRCLLRKDDVEGKSYFYLVMKHYSMYVCLCVWALRIACVQRKIVLIEYDHKTCYSKEQ